MPHVAASTTGKAWENSLKLFWKTGYRITSRGDPCTEVEDVLFEVSRPDRSPQISSSYPDSLVPLVEDFRARLVNAQMGQTSKLNERLYRWPQRDGTGLDQHSEVLSLMRQFPDGRYSIISFWDPEEELSSNMQIGPLLAYPRIRAGRMNMTVVSRSLDAVMGAMQVLVGFAGYQQHLAGELEVGIGSLRVLALSYQLLDLDVPRIPAALGGSA